MNEANRAFQEYWNRAQPLLTVTTKTGDSLTQRLTAAQIREVRNQIEEAFMAGWNACGQVVQEIT